MNDTINSDPVQSSDPVVIEEVPGQSVNPQPQVQEAEVVTESTEEKKEEEIVSNPEIRPVRTDETGDKVYAIYKDKRYWIRNPETMAKMGFYLGREKKIPFSELLQFSEGDPIDLTVPDAQYPWDMPEKPKIVEPDKPYKIW